jgi:hypothetical protein
VKRDRHVNFSRRALLKAGAAASCSWRSLAQPPPLPDSRHLVSTPEKRAAYLQDLLRALCTDIGPRLACTEACEKGAQLIKREMEKALPEVRLDTFAVTGWSLDGEQELRIGERRLETYVAQYGPGTPEAGIRGVIGMEGERYRIVGKASGRTLANIDLGPFGPAVASSYRGSDRLPRFSVGRQEIPLLNTAAKEGLPVFAKAVVREIPNCMTSNVAGTLPGGSRDEILYVAHADTVYVSPGASDNTASMIAMLMLAHGFSGTRPRRTLTFLASTAEEGGSKGAQHYALTRKREGTLSRVKVCVNLDSLTYGPNFQITTTDSELQRTILDVHRDLGIRADPRIIQRDDTMDSAPFGAAGARTVHLNSRGHDARTLPLNHRPDDTAGTIDPALIEASYRILMEFTRRLDAMPSITGAAQPAE